MKMELVKGPLAEAWGMLRSDFRAIFATMLKVALLTLIVVFAFLIGAAAVAVALWNLSIPAALALALVLALAGVFLGSVVSSVNYNFIDARSGKRRLDFSATIRANILPMLGYDLANALIFLVISAPFFAIFLVLAPGGLQGVNGLAAEILFRVGLTAVSAVVSLFIQFTIFELLVSRKGLLESFGRSLRIARTKPLETIAFSVIIWALESVIAIPFSIALVLLVFGAILAVPKFGLGALAVILVIAAAIVVVLAALTNSVSVTAKYKYWSRARKA